MIFLLMFSPFWWLLLVASWIVITFSLEKESGTGATLTMLATLFALVFFSDTPIVSFVFANPWVIVGGVIGYFVAGSIWAVGKWYFYNIDRLEEYEDEKYNWLTKKGRNPKAGMPEELKKDWTNYLSGTSKWTLQYTRTVQVKPLVREHLALITMWMTYWPWSMLWSLLDDVIRNIFRRIQRLLNSLMESITEKVFRKTDDDYNG